MELVNLQRHISELPLKKWDKLFSLITEIASQTEFGEDHFGEDLPNGGKRIFHAWDPSQVVNRFWEITAELDLVPVYDYTNWEEGNKLLNNSDADFSHLDTVALIKLFTIMIRADRFCDGYLIGCFENGNALKILTALKNQIVIKQD